MKKSVDAERMRLLAQIREWNAARLDLFEVSDPDERLEFYGVMRFFYQGDDFKYQTKCLRVSSTASTKDVIDALISKLHPDASSTGNDKYALYETHNLEERRMKQNEQPLVVQLTWAKDDKDGKFILKNESRRRRSTDLTNHAMLSNYGMSRSTLTLTNGYDNPPLRTQSSAIYSSSSNFFSRRFSNSKKGRRRSRAEKETFEDAEEAKRLAEEISGKPPESSFTRTISNPDDVMKRKRQKKLEFRLEQFSGVKGDGEIGGTLKIYGDSINPDIPYKTLLLSVNDTAEKILSETLDKYGLSFEEHRFYILVQQNIPPRDDRNRGNVQEIILHKQDCPLGILVHCPPKRGSAIFSVRKATKHDKFPSVARMPPFSMTKEVTADKSSLNPKTKVNNNDRQVLSTSIIPSDDYSDLSVDPPRLRKLIIDLNGSVCEDDDGVYSLSSLVNVQLKDVIPIDTSKVIKVGSQSSSVGTYPNILIPLENHNDIRPIHCHISVKLDPQSNSMKFQITPSLDSASRTPRPCVIFINQRRIDRTTRITNGDTIQLGQSAVFRFEEFDDEYESINSFSVDDVAQEVHEESVENSAFTDELPITVKYKYKKSESVVDKIMDFSNEYAEKWSKELFSSNNVKGDRDMVDERFTLSPAYMMYLVMRAGLVDEDHVVELIKIIADRVDHIIQDDQCNVEKEIFWLSNSSELLHLLQYDSDLRHYSVAAQEVLAIAIERAFSIIQQQFTQDFMILLPALLSEDDLDIDDNTQEDNTPCLDRASILTEQGGIDYPIQHLLQTLSLAFNLFQNCQVNVALTIQMFSQLFHLLNTWLLNTVLGEQMNTDDSGLSPVSICQEWGNRLTRRLNRIRYWSEINGLDMAANCHLQKIYQVAELMEADKRDLNIFGEKCLEMVNLNGSQLQHLLSNCQDYELPDGWIEVVVNTAIQLHDQGFNETCSKKQDSSQTKSTSLPPLFEDMELRLPLLLPADGYCCDRGIVSVPNDLKHMLSSMKDMIKYRLNPPIIDEMDVRWKAYMSTCENTPTVSRSNTIDLLTSPTKSDVVSLPRNTGNDSIHSEEASLSETISTPKERYQKKSTALSQPISPQVRDVLPVIKKQQHNMQQNIQQQEQHERPRVDNSWSTKQDSDSLFELKLTKINNSLGLSIIAVKALNDDVFRIYVKDIIVGGAGHKSCKISSGDQIVSIDGNPLYDMNQDEAVVFMKKTKSQVVLLIDKSAAQRHGVMDAIVQARSTKTPQNIQKPSQRLSNNQPPPVKPAPSKPPSVSKNPNKANGSLISLPPSSRSQMTNKISDVVPEPDYSSLPIRKHKYNGGPSSKLAPSAKNETPVYKVDSDTSYHSLQNVSSKTNKSNSNPSLYTKHQTPSQLPEISSDSSLSDSMPSSDDEESLTSEPKANVVPYDEKRNSSSVYAKIPPQNPSKPVMRMPLKAGSDLNISSKSAAVPRHEITSSETELRMKYTKKPSLIRSGITQSLDPIINVGTTSQVNREPVLLNKPVLVADKSVSSGSETLSSDSESSSAPSLDPSSQPQRKLSSEPLHKNLTKSQDIESPSKKSEPLPQRKTSAGVLHLGGFQKPARISMSTSPNLSSGKDSLSSLPKGTLKTSLDDVGPSKEACHPLPSPPHLLYQPPSDLQENDWFNEEPSNRKIPSEEDTTMRRKLLGDNVRPEMIHSIEEPPNRKIPFEEDTTTRRKLITDNVRRDKEDLDKKAQVPQVEPVVSSDVPKAPVVKSAVKYGRPQFYDHSSLPTHPNPLLTKAELTNNNNNKSVVTSAKEFGDRDPHFQVGLVVPPSPIIKSKVNLSNESEKERHQEDVDELSFKEKMKLFAAKIGEETVIERKKFGSKQRRMESGDYS